MNRSPTLCVPSASVLIRCAIAIVTISGSAAYAQEMPNASFSGFGTIGIVHSTEKEGDFTSVAEQPSGAGHTRSWNFDSDTKLAAQLDVGLTEQLSAAAQMMIRQRYDDKYSPELMMAFAKWRFAPEYSLRAGRLPLPVFLISDSRNVGFSQAQIRPPVDMYYGFDLYHYDGADLTWTTDIGGVALKSQAYIGTTKPRLPGDATLKFSPLVGANITMETDELTLRASYIRSKASASSPAINATFQGVRDGFPTGALFPGSPAIPGDPSVADQYGVTDRVASYSSIGLNYDTGQWFVTSELGVVGSVGISAHQTLGYVTAGMRIASLSPYATVSGCKDRIAGTTTNNPVVDALRIGSAAHSQKTFGIGMRWDAMKNLALKTQFDHVEPDSGSVGLLINTQNSYRPGTAYNILSAAADFVF